MAKQGTSPEKDDDKRAHNVDKQDSHKKRRTRPGHSAQPQSPATQNQESLDTEPSHRAHPQRTRAGHRAGPQSPVPWWPVSRSAPRALRVRVQWFACSIQILFATEKASTSPNSDCPKHALCCCCTAALLQVTGLKLRFLHLKMQSTTP